MDRSLGDSAERGFDILVIFVKFSPGLDSLLSSCQTSLESSLGWTDGFVCCAGMGAISPPHNSKSNNEVVQNTQNMPGRQKRDETQE